MAKRNLWAKRMKTMILKAETTVLALNTHLFIDHDDHKQEANSILKHMISHKSNERIKQIGKFSF